MTDLGPIVASAAGRSVVAEVNGRPVYDDCVRIQAQAHDLDRRGALEECIDFELLAQEAERRGFADHPSVREVRKNEVVRQLFDAEIMEPMRSRESVDRATLEAAYERYRKYIYAPERRRVTHVFAAFETFNEKEGTPDDARTRALAEAIHQALAGRSDLKFEDLLGQAKEVLAGPEWASSRALGPRVFGPFDESKNDVYEEVFWVHLEQANLPWDFSQAVFEIPEPGMVSRPTRSRYGWHVVLFLEREAPRMENVDQAADWLFQRLRVERYLALFEEVVGDMDAIQVNEEALERLQAAEDGMFGEPSGVPAGVPAGGPSGVPAGGPSGGPGGSPP